MGIVVLWDPGADEEVGACVAHKIPNGGDQEAIGGGGHSIESQVHALERGERGDCRAISERGAATAGNDDGVVGWRGTGRCFGNDGEILVGGAGDIADRSDRGNARVADKWDTNGLRSGGQAGGTETKLGGGDRQLHIIDKPAGEGVVEVVFGIEAEANLDFLANIGGQACGNRLETRGPVGKRLVSGELIGAEDGPGGIAHLADDHLGGVAVGVALRLQVRGKRERWGGACGDGGEIDRGHCQPGDPLGDVVDERFVRSGVAGEGEHAGAALGPGYLRSGADAPEGCPGFDRLEAEDLKRGG